jgi:serine/threonine protein kinase
MNADVRTVLAAVDSMASPGEGHQVLRVLAEWTVEDWRTLLRELPMDSGTFAAEFETSWDSAIAALETWCTPSGDRPGGEPDDPTKEGPETSSSDDLLLGYLGVVLLTLVSLRHSEQRRTRGGDLPEVPRETSAHDCDRLCRSLLRDVVVQEALRTLYAPSPGGDAVREWENLDFSTLEFHRHGTTSFILRGTPLHRAQGQLRPFALKCIIYPFLRIPTIGRATEAYAETYALASAEVHHLVWVWASTTSWILMDFVPGQTLAERLEAEAAPRRSGVLDAFFPTDVAGDGAAPAHRSLRLDLIEKFGHELFLALSDLEHCGVSHCDLSPSNIIVVPVPNEDRETLKLIDLGVNYLYLHNMPGRTGGLDAAYVAPEVRSGASDPTPTSVGAGTTVAGPVVAGPAAGTETRQAAAGSSPIDLYSLGQLLILLGAGRLEFDGTVPGIFYAEAPLIARFIEDLTDRDPRRRLLVFGPRSHDSTSVYADLSDYLGEELEAVKAERAEHGAPRTSLWWSDVAAVFQPLSGALSRQRRLWQVRRRQSLYRDRTRNMRVRWLLGWSTLSAGCWALTSTLVVMWTLRGAGWDWDNQIIVFLQKLSGASSDEFPFLDQLRVDDYRLPPEVGSVALGTLGLTFTLVGVKYYQSLFAAVSPLATGWRSGSLTVQAVVAEVAMRAWTVLPVVTILPPFLVQPLWWPIFVAGAMSIVTLANWASSQFARTALARGRERGLSTVPGRVSGVATYASWIPGNTFYALTLWIVALLLVTGAAQDTMVYLVGIALVNIVQLYVVKCGFQGPDIRAGLARACITAERLRHLS